METIIQLNLPEIIVLPKIPMLTAKYQEETIIAYLLRITKERDAAFIAGLQAESLQDHIDNSENFQIINKESVEIPDSSEL